ncbi:MAG: tryptophan synthase subunit alpha [Chloroflexi bacterium]|nr:tryptophan synthase subunit alpha [Chloroflexota bacterium]
MGWQQIEETLQGSMRQGRVGIIPFLTIGFPDVAATLDIVPALVEGGASVVELGVPFSDPLADGPTIQRSSFHALRQGVTFRGCLEVCAQLRGRGVVAPLVLMGYYNPIFVYGPEAAARDAAEAGVDGFIVADLPAEETGPFSKACSQFNLALVPLLAPTSTQQRIARSCQGARGFIYCVSVTGVTGARQAMPEGVPELVGRVRQQTALPVAVGFGISRREHVTALGAYADAAVVGSALIQVIEAAPRDQAAARARGFIANLAGLSPSAEGQRG